MKSMEGYLNVMAVIQKFFDQAISSNTSYNPQNFDGNEVPASVLIGDLLKAYQLGIKTLYYHNTYDGKGEEEIEVNDLHAEPSQVGGLTDEELDKEVAELLQLTEDCDSCSI